MCCKNLRNCMQSNILRVLIYDKKYTINYSVCELYK